MSKHSTHSPVHKSNSLTVQDEIDLGKNADARHHWCKAYLSHLWAYRNFIIFLVAPLLLLPLIFCFEHDEELKKPMRCAYVLALMVVYWVTEAVPIAITSLLPMVLYPLLMVEKAVNLAPQYMDETNMAIIASILVVKAFEDAELHKRFAFAVIRVVGVQPRWLLLGLMVVSWILSALLQNAMAATLVIPVVLEIVNELKEAIAKDYRDVSPEVRNKTVSKKKVKILWRRYENMLVLGVAYSCSIGGTATLLGAAENLIVFDEIAKLYDENHCSFYNPLNFGSWILYGLPGAVIFLPIAWFWIFLYFNGPGYAFGITKTPDYIKAHKDRLWNIVQEMNKKLKPMGSRQWIVLGHIALMVVLFFTRMIQSEPLIGWELIAPGYVKESTVSCFIAILLFAFPVSMPRKKDNRLRIRKPKLAIHWTEDDGGRAFNIVMLIGGGLAATYGATTSGFAEWISGLIYEGIKDLGPTMTAVIVIFFGVFLTEVISNAASVHFMLPVYKELSERQELNPMLYLMPTALTSSFAFMFPVATPPNAIAFSLTKGLRVIDMVGVGFVMNLIGIGLVHLATFTYGNAYFDFFEPAWKIDANGTITCRDFNGEFF